MPNSIDDARLQDDGRSCELANSSDVEELPRFLYRSWVNESNGTNSRTEFRPAFYTTNKTHTRFGMTYDCTGEPLDKQLRKALVKNKVARNPFIFTTASPLYAFQHAITKAKEGHNVHITCIDTSTALNASGKPVQFRSMPKLMEELKMEPLTTHRYPYKEMVFTDVYVTTDSIILGEGSTVASWDALLDAGIFGLYPEYAIMSRRHIPGLETPVKDLRNIWLKLCNDLTLKELSLAAKLALKFESLSTREVVDVPSHLLSALMALKGQNVGGKQFATWLDTYSHPRTSGDAIGNAIQASAVLEVDRYAELLNVISMRCIPIDQVNSLDTDIPYDHIVGQQKAYNKVVKERNRLRKEAEARDKLESLNRLREKGEKEAPLKRKAGETDDDLSANKRVKYQSDPIATSLE